MTKLNEGGKNSFLTVWQIRTDAFEYKNLIEPTTGAVQADALVNNVQCEHFSYNPETHSFHFDLFLGDCGMETVLADDNIKVIKKIIIKKIVTIDNYHRQFDMIHKMFSVHEHFSVHSEIAEQRRAVFGSSIRK